LDITVTISLSSQHADILGDVMSIGNKPWLHCLRSEAFSLAIGVFNALAQIEQTEMGRGGKSSDAIRDDTVWREDGGKSFLVPVFYPPSERRLTKVFIFIFIKVSILYSIYLARSKAFHFHLFRIY
jgi:hypothetical protein